jgi:hypothetical protein
MKRNSMKKQERAAIEHVAKHFSATWEECDGSPKSRMVIAGKRVAIEIATIKQRGAAPAITIKPRLRVDKTALGLIERLRTGLDKSVPDGRTVIVTVTAPIRQDSKTSAVLEQTIRATLAGRPPGTDVKIAIHGNQIRVRVVKSGIAQAPKLIGLVHNPDPNADLVLLASAEALLECLVAEAGRRTARHPGGSWLLVANEHNFLPVEIWRRIFAQLSTPAGFEAVLMVFAEGRVERLDERAGKK